jgi:hypothetical protein
VNEINIEEDIKLLQEIKDIRDELNMLSRVLGDQLYVTAKLSQWAKEQSVFKYDWGVDSRLLQIKRMDEDAERVEKSVGFSIPRSTRALIVVVEPPPGLQTKAEQY